MAPRSAPASTNSPAVGDGAAVGNGDGEGVGRGVGEEVEFWPQPERISTSTDPNAIARRCVQLARTTGHPVAPHVQVRRGITARRKNRADLRAVVVAVVECLVDQKIRSMRQLGTILAGRQRDVDLADPRQDYAPSHGLVAQLVGQLVEGARRIRPGSGRRRRALEIAQVASVGAEQVRESGQYLPVYAGGAGGQRGFGQVPQVLDQPLRGPCVVLERFAERIHMAAGSSSGGYRRRRPPGGRDPVRLITFGVTVWSHVGRSSHLTVQPSSSCSSRMPGSQSEAVAAVASSSDSVVATTRTSVTSRAAASSSTPSPSPRRRRSVWRTGLIVLPDRAGAWCGEICPTGRALPAFSAARATVADASSSSTRSRISCTSSLSAAALSNSRSRAAWRISASIWATSFSTWPFAMTERSRSCPGAPPSP